MRLQQAVGGFFSFLKRTCTRRTEDEDGGDNDDDALEIVANGMRH